MYNHVILGAGISGLTAAIKLKENDLDNQINVIILEKEKNPGGLMFSTGDCNHWWDSGSYIFHDYDPLVKKFPDLFTSNNLLYHRIWLKNKFFQFPLNVNEFIKYNSLSSNLKTTFSLVIGRICRIIRNDKNANIWLKNRIGNELLKSTYLDEYLVKLQTIKSDRISQYLCNKRLKSLNFSFSSIVSKVLKKEKKQVTINAVYYPSCGVIKIIDALIQRCIELKINISYECHIDRIIKKNEKYIISYNNNQIIADQLFTSIPLNSFFNIFDNFIPQILKTEIEYTDSLITMFLVKQFVNIETITVIQTFDPKYSWKKLTSIKMPDGKYAITVETTFSVFKKIIPSKIIDSIEKDLTLDLCLFTAKDIISIDSKIIKSTYPIFQVNTLNKINHLIDYCEKHHNVHFIGRQGTFKYYSSYDSIVTTEKVVDEYCRNKKF